MGRPANLNAALPGLGKLLRRFHPYLRKHRGLGLGAFAALFAEVAVRILEPWPLKFIFDHVLGMAGESDAGGSFGAGGSSTSNVLLLAVGAIVILAVARALFAYLSTVGFTLVGQRVLTEVRGDLFRHLQRLSLDFHSRARGGDLTVRVISDVGLLKEVLATAALPLLGNVLILAGMIGVMFWMNAKLALIAIAVLPLFWLRSVRLSRRIREVSRDQRRREGAMAATAAEALGAIRIVQVLSLDRVFSETFTAQDRKSMREGAKGKRLQAKLERTVDVLTALSTALVLGFGVDLVLAGELTPGDLLVFVTYLKNAFKPVRDFAKYTARLAKASAAGERILDLLDVEPEVRDLPGARAISDPAGHIRFKGVHFRYADGSRVLRGLDFDAAPGQMVALVGESGIGNPPSRTCCSGSTTPRPVGS
jgi:ATP-binding cassette, subfamily B, bacterial